MVRVRTAPDYMAAEVAFLDMAHSERLLSILKIDDKTSRADRDHLEKQKEQIRTFLNYLELMALAIQRHVLDEQLCKDYARSIFIRRWEMSEELVKKIQEDSPRSYIHFEAVAKRWKASAPDDRRGMLRKLFDEFRSLLKAS
jgi:hypothetical protein